MSLSFVPTRVPLLAVALIASSLFGVVPAMQHPPIVPVELECDYVLFPQSGTAGCASPSPVCPGIGGETCCRHFHEAIQFNRAVHWFKHTGMLKGPSMKKYFTARDSFCFDWDCVEGTNHQDALHYEEEDTLVSCVN